MRWREVQTWSIMRRIYAVIALILLSSAVTWAAGLSISDRPFAGPLDGTEILGIIQNGLDRKITSADIGALSSAAQGLGPNFALTDGNVMTGVTEAKPLSLRGGSGQETNGADFDQNSGGFFEWVCVVANVRNACNYIKQLSAGFYWEIKNHSGTSIFRLTNDTGALTNVTLDAEATGNTITLPFKHNLKPVGCAGTVGTLLLDTNATLAPTPTCVAGTTNTTLIQGYADFPDSDGEYQFQDSFRVPADGNCAAIDLQIFWKSAATTNAVVWQVQTLFRGDGEIEDAAWNTAQAFAADTAKGTTLQLNDVTLTGLTSTGCTPGDMAYIKIFRQRTHASDTITGIVSLKNGELTVRRGT